MKLNDVWVHTGKDSYVKSLYIAITPDKCYSADYGGGILTVGPLPVALVNNCLSYIIQVISE